MVEDATKPEFDGYHPGVIIRACNTLNEATETVSFVPFTSTAPQKMTPYIHEMSCNPNPVDTRLFWAICNHIYTVRLSRLELYYDSKGAHLAPKIETADLDAIFVAIRNGFTAMRTNVENHAHQGARQSRDGCARSAVRGAGCDRRGSGTRSPHVAGDGGLTPKVRNHISRLRLRPHFLMA